MKKHAGLILIVVVIIIAVILLLIASGNKNNLTGITGTMPTTTDNGGIVFPLLRSANDATVNPVAVRYLGTGRPSLN